jgi:hypothetical protein
LIAEGGEQVCIRYAADRHQVQHPCILAHLVLLELLDRKVALVYSNKVDQLAVLLDVDVRLLNLGLQVEDLLLLAGFRLEERLERGLAERQLLELLLVRAFLALCLHLALHNFLAAAHSVYHSLNIEHLSSNP